jgi:hypothetical protein
MKTILQKFKLVLVFVLLISTYSCKVLKVTSDNGDVNGIPFYAQKLIVKQQTSYLYNWQEISLIKEDKKDDKTVQTKIYTVRIEKGQDLKPIYELLNTLNNDSKNSSEVMAAMDALKIETLNTNSINDISKVNLISNSSKDVVTIDYTNKYYLNAKMPWFGNSSLSQKINSNGTLGEATSTSDSQVDELVTSAVALATPISNFKIAELDFLNNTTEKADEIVEDESFKRGIAAYAKNKQDEKITTFIKKALEQAQNKHSYKLNIIEKGYLYTFTKDLEYKNKAQANTPIPFDLKKGNYIRTNWPATPKKLKKPEKKTIDVSAQIGLPKKE